MSTISLKNTRSKLPREHSRLNVWPGRSLIGSRELAVIFAPFSLGREGLTYRVPGIKPLVSAIVEHCIQPRALLSPMDAEFCAQFIRVLHLQGTPGFYTLMCYDKVRPSLHGLLVYCRA